MHLTRARLAVLGSMLVLSATMVDQSHAQFVNYDTFSNGFIDPNLWAGTSTEGGFGAPSAEVIRAVENGQLRLALVSWGNNTSDTGNTVSRQGLQLRQTGTLGGAGSIIAFKVKVTVTDALVQDCPANPGTEGAIRARAQILGWFFNDGTSTGATDDTGNAIAGMQLTREADGSNQIQGFFQTCTNANCSTVVTHPGTAVPAFATTWSLNTPVVLKVIWDRTNGTFKFKVKNSLTQAVESHQISYAGIVTDAGSPSNGDFKAIRVHNNVKNCTAGRKQVAMDALFDNVAVQRQPVACGFCDGL